MQDLDRSTDGGVTWTPILHDVASNPAMTTSRTRGEFAMRAITIPAPGVVVLAENGNGDGVLISRDEGSTWQLSTWQLADGGLAGPPISSVTFAPSDPQVAYAAVDTRSVEGGAYGLYMSRDGGSSWTSVNLPKWLADDHESTPPAATGCPATEKCPTFPQVQVDPRDPAHVYLLVAVDTGPTHVAILESTDFAESWTPVAVPQPAVATTLPVFTQLLVTNTARHGLRLYLTNYVDTAGLGPLADVASGTGTQTTGVQTTWSPLPITPAPLGRLAADPTDGDRMVYLAPGASDEVGTTVAVTARGYTSTDGFTTATPTAVGVLSPGLSTGGVLSTGGAGGGAANAAYVDPAPSVLVGGNTGDPDVVLQPDRLGGFTVAVHAGCIQAAATTCFSNEPPPRSTNDDSYDFHGYARYVAPLPAGAAGATGSAPASGSAAAPGGSAGGLSAPPAPASMSTLRTCQIPPGQAQPVSPATYTPATNDGLVGYGSLTFDGASLLYTLPQDSGVIRMMDPVTCQVTGAISVQFDPQELLSIAQYLNDPSLAAAPSIDTLTYDSNHDMLWFSLEQRDPQRNIVPIFTATTTSTANPSALVATASFHEFAPRFFSQSQGEDLLAYDDTDDTIWQTVWNDGVPHDGTSPTGSTRPIGLAGHLTPSGKVLPSCANGFDNGGLATWVVGGPHRLFVQLEDDRTLAEVDTIDCHVVRYTQHRNFGEPGNEDEQMACDPLTFSSTSPGYGGPPTTALWLRDANTQTIVAYTMPDGSCPVPTYTTYERPTVLPVGAQARFCATLVMHTPRGLPHASGRPAGHVLGSWPRVRGR